MAKKKIRNQKVITALGKKVKELRRKCDLSQYQLADELLKLKSLDPNIMDWIKERTAKEQEARLVFNDRKMSLLEGGHKSAVRIDFCSMICALIIILSGMVLSAYLISIGSNTTGTIFAGGIILIAITGFLNFRKKNIPPTKQ